MSPAKSLFGKKELKPSPKGYPLPASCSVSSLTEFLADGNASFLRAARSGNVEKIIEHLKENIDINTSNANGLNSLHLAAKEGHVNVVTELLKRGANVNAATKKGNTALHIAALAGQEEVVRVLVQLGANINAQSSLGFTPLYMAAQENHDNVVSFLLSNGANQSLATEDGFTPLAVALQQGHDKVVAVLLENDTKGRVRLPALHIAAKKDDCKAATLLLQSDHNPDVTSKSGFTPLHIAAHYGNDNIAKILLNKGADVNYAAKHQITPLHVASKWGKMNMVLLLLDRGAIIDASTRDGLTPLHCAARSGHDQVVDLLLEKGAPFLAKTKNGLAPLHMASQGDHVDSARILLYHKAPVDDVTVDYLTALHVAAHCGHVKVAKLLLDRKADPNARALNGFTPLHIACKKNRIKVVELLLKHGASIEATTESGLTPLHVASFMGCMNIVIYLIQNGANPDVPTVRGETPLHLAARANQTDIIRILLRNGASVDARAREEQTPLHIAARLGNVDIVSLLLQHGAAVDATTKDMYTALHIASKEDQEEVASSLLDHGASLTATTKKGFTPLHLAAKYGNIKVARLLIQKDAPVDAQGKNGVTPLHVAAHYDHVNVALLLLDKGASPHAMAKNGYTPLHIAAKKNQMDIASTLLEYRANTNSESKAGFTPLHLASQEGHVEMVSLLIDHKADVNHKANNGLTPLHLCAQEDKVDVATVLAKHKADIGPQTKAGYTPLHVASHFGQQNMVRFLLQRGADVHTTTSHGYTSLHQAAQQGHTLVVNLLLENQASPNVTTTQGQTPLSIAQRLGYISVVETLKVVTETTVTTTTTTVTEEKYKVVAPETMQETFMTDSEDEGGEEAMLGDQSYGYLTADEMKSLGDDSLPIDVTKDEKHHDLMQSVRQFGAPMVEEDKLSPQPGTPIEGGFSEKFSPDNVDLARVPPIHAGFLVSFMVDARGGAMRGCRHSGVRVIIPPRKASMPMRITCRYLRKEKLMHPPPLMEGEACASRILEIGPVGAKFLGPVIIEVPHFASTRGKEREITILRSDKGDTWREHTLEASEEAVQEVLNESFEGEELSALEDLNTNRITRILTTDFPQYFAIVTRIRQEVHAVGPEGGMVSSTVVPQVQAIFPEGALTKKIRVGLQAQPIAPELVAKLLGNRVAVSPIVTVEPRRRKFHKQITLTIPVPQATTKGMINQYSGDAPTLRLLCSITGSTKSGGSSKAQWEDVTGSTPLTFVNDCVSFTTTVSARFWLMDCRQVNEVTRFATELYQEAVYVPFMSKFVIFAKRYDPYESQLRVFCMTDDKEDKTLECQEHFTEVAKSRDVEVLEGKMQYLEFAGNIAPVTKSGEQLQFPFQAFHENRLPFAIRVKDPHIEPMGRIAFMKEPKQGRGEPPQIPICNLNVALPELTLTEGSGDLLELVTLEKRYDFIQEAGLSKPEQIHRADLRLSDIARELDKDWVLLAQQLDLSENDISQIKAETASDNPEQALLMLRLWLQKSGSKATGNELEKGLKKINREDIVKSCMFNVELVTDDVEKAVAKVHLDQSGFDVFKEELGSSREASMRRGASLDVSYDEQDIMKEAESAAETSSETGSLFERDQISQALTDDKDAKLRRASKTPPPSPVDETDQGDNNADKIKEVLLSSTSLHSKVKGNILKEPIEEDHKSQEIAGCQESETWPSIELDTSQVSISSLPDDEKSEPTTATASDIVPAARDRSIDFETTELVGSEAYVCEKASEIQSNEEPSGVHAEYKTLEGFEKKPLQAEMSVTKLTEEKENKSKENIDHQPVGISDLEAEKEHAQAPQAAPDEDSDSGCAFINTAFVGAELIDQVDRRGRARSRSPYEVVRDEQPEVFSEDPPNITVKTTYVSKYIERHRPILQHIPSEISEEDLVERELVSPDLRRDSETAEEDLAYLQSSGVGSLINDQAEISFMDKPLKGSSVEATSTVRTSVSNGSRGDDNISKTRESVLTSDTRPLKLSVGSDRSEMYGGSFSADEVSQSVFEEGDKNVEDDICPSNPHLTVICQESKTFVSNGPGEVEYHPEYDDYDQSEYGHEYSLDVGDQFHPLPSARDVKSRTYSCVSDDVIDSEIGEALKYDQTFDDIIERPTSPEPPVEDDSEIGKNRSEVDKDGSSMYSSDPLISDVSKVGFAYGMQFEKDILDAVEEAMDLDSDPYSEEKEPVFGYDIRFDRELDEDIPGYGDLYTHEEVDEDALEGAEKAKSLPKLKKTQEFDVLAGRKYFSKNVDSDEVSVSSLQDFEHLEADIVSGRKSSVSSVDSLNGAAQAVSKSGEHDDLSMSSLTEFERLERECLEEKIDPAMQESVTQLSEIEEGHESQASETSQENKSDGCKDDDLSIAEDLNQHLEDIDKIILKPNKLHGKQSFQHVMEQGTNKTGHSDEDVFLPEIYKGDILKKDMSETVMSRSHESFSKSDGKNDDIDQDSLRDELSLKPDSLADDRQEYLDSLHEGKSDDADSLQGDMPDEMRDSLLEDRLLEDDSLRDMDILPDESSLSMESSLAAVMSHDSSKADEKVMEKLSDIRNQVDSHTLQTLEHALASASKDTRLEITVSEIPKGDVMLSSTDSLEQSSSAAAFHFESESAMSTSMTGAFTSEDNTMISSTDTLEHEGRITFRYEDIPIDDLQILVKDGRQVIVDSEGNIQTEYDVKHFLTTEDNMNNDLNLCSKGFMETSIYPESLQVQSTIKSVSYMGEPGESQRTQVYHSTNGRHHQEGQYESSYCDPDVEVEEIHTTDEFGNPKVIKTMKKVIHTQTQLSSSSSSDNVEEKLKEFLRERAAGENAGVGEEIVQEERSVDNKGNIVVVRTVQQQILSQPEVHSQTFTGSDAATKSEKYIEKFKTLDPTEDVCEYEKIDDQGNVVRVTQQVIIKPEMHSVSFSGPNARQQMEEYMKKFSSVPHNGDDSSNSRDSGSQSFSSVQIASTKQVKEYVPSAKSSHDPKSGTEFTETSVSSSIPETSVGMHPSDPSSSSTNGKSKD